MQCDSLTAGVEEDGAVSVLGPGNLGEAVNAYLDEKMRGAKFKHAAALEESKLEANDAELKAARDYKRDHYREYRDDEILYTEANQHETKADKRRDEEQLHDTPEAAIEQQEKRKQKIYQQQSAERKKYAKDQAAEQANADAAALRAWNAVKRHDASEVKEKAAVNALPQ